MSQARNFADLLASGTVLSDTKLPTITSAKLDDNAIHGNRNLIINGAMQVAQRGTSTTSANSSTFFADRFYYESGSMDALVIDTAQVADAPVGTGLKYSIKATVTTPEVGSGDTTEFAQVNMFLEHQDSSQKLAWGTSNAKPMTVSFYVKSSVTGVFLFTLHKSGGAAGFGTHYTINSANTWEKKTIVIPAATDSSWASLSDNGRGIETRWSWRVGSNVTKTVDGNWDYTGGYFGFSNVSNTGGDAFVTTNGATWQLTGVQYEIGETATPFEHRSYGDELARCQRYYVENTVCSSQADMDGANFMSARGFFPVSMRTVPTISNMAIQVSGNMNTGGSINSTQASTESVSLFSIASGAGNTFVYYNFDASAEL